MLLSLPQGLEFGSHACWRKEIIVSDWAFTPSACLQFALELRPPEGEI